MTGDFLICPLKVKSRLSEIEGNYYLELPNAKPRLIEHDEYGSVQQHLQPRHIQEMFIPVSDDWRVVQDMIDAGNMFIYAMENMSQADKKIRTVGFDSLLNAQ